MNAFISKSRKPKFELTLSIHDLNNVPLVNGTSFVKWHLPHSSSADHRGRTSKSPVQDHTVSWKYSKTLQVRLTMDKSNMLQELLVHLEIVQDYGSGVRGAEKITLGNIALNLAEYVEMGQGGPLSPGAGDAEEEGVVRRYLMQDSKINSTLKIGINMRQIDGEKNYVAPPLKTAPVFGGIAGIMGQEQGDADELGHMPSINRSREAGELQDVYRNSLAAFWAAQAGELPADQCIEDIFSGGDGWRSKKAKGKVPRPRESQVPGHHEDEGDDYERWHQEGGGGGTGGGKRHTRNQSASSSTSRHTVTARSAGADMVQYKTHQRGQSGDLVETFGNHAVYAQLGRPRNDHHPHRSHGRHHGSHDHGHGHERGSGDGFRTVQEVDEFDLREDLMSWQIPRREGLEGKAS